MNSGLVEIKSYSEHLPIPGANYKLSTDGQVVFESIKALRDYIDGVHASLLQKLAILELKKGGTDEHSCHRATINPA